MYSNNNKKTFFSDATHKAREYLTENVKFIQKMEITNYFVRQHQSTRSSWAASKAE